jgi:hypothetical protein
MVITPQTPHANTAVQNSLALRHNGRWDGQRGVPPQSESCQENALRPLQIPMPLISPPKAIPWNPRVRCALALLPIQRWTGASVARTAVLLHRPAFLSPQDSLTACLSGWRSLLITKGFLWITHVVSQHIRRPFAKTHSCASERPCVQLCGRVPLGLGRTTRRRQRQGEQGWPKGNPLGKSLTPWQAPLTVPSDPSAYGVPMLFLGHAPRCFRCAARWVFPGATPWFLSLEAPGRFGPCPTTLRERTVASVAGTWHGEWITKVAAGAFREAASWVAWPVKRFLRGGGADPVWAALWIYPVVARDRISISRSEM